MRHALPVRKELQDGPADPGLSPDGVAQSEHLADYLNSEHFDAIYTSPLRRAIETAAPLCATTGITPSVVDGLAEFDRDAAEYVPVEELKAAGDPRWNDIMNGVTRDGTSPAVFTATVIRAVDSLVDAHPGHRIVAVCHGGVINAYLAHLLGLGDAYPGFFYPNYTSIHRVAAARSGQRSIVTINETSHLRGTGLPMGVFQKG